MLSIFAKFNFVVWYQVELIIIFKALNPMGQSTYLKKKEERLLATF